MHFWGRKLTSFEGSCIWPKALGVKGLWIWTGMHFLGRKLTSFEGSCIWPKALGGGLEGQRSLDLDRYAFFGAKTDVL